MVMIFDVTAMQPQKAYGAQKTFVAHNATVFNSTATKCNFLFCSFFNKWEKKDESP